MADRFATEKCFVGSLKNRVCWRKAWNKLKGVRKEKDIKMFDFCALERAFYIYQQY